MRKKNTKLWILRFDMLKYEKWEIEGKTCALQCNFSERKG